jgi:hypothetical protein
VSGGHAELLTAREVEAMARGCSDAPRIGAFPERAFKRASREHIQTRVDQQAEHELALVYDPSEPVEVPSTTAIRDATPLGWAASWFAGGVAFGTTALF